MAFLAPVLSIAGTLFGGVAALGQANYKSQVAKNNAEIAARNAGLASDAAQIEQMRSDREYAAQRGMLQAQAGASGLDVLGGSQRAVLGLVDRSRAEAATDIRRQGEAQSSDLLAKMAGFKGQANAYKSAGITSLIGAGFEAAGTAASAFGPTKGKSKYPWSK